MSDLPPPPPPNTPLVLVHWPGSIDATAFRLISVQGQEQISAPFLYTLSLAGADANADFSDVVGSPVTFAYVGPRHASGAAPNTLSGGETRVYVNGIVTALRSTGEVTYEVDMRPALWRLALANKYELYVNVTVPDVIAAVLDRHGIAFETSYRNPMTTIEKHDWLQNGETDLSFISQLMQRTGIFYFFKQTPQTAGCEHVLVLADNAEAYADCYTPNAPDDQPQKLRALFSLDDTRPSDDLILAYSYQQQLTPQTGKTIMSTMGQRVSTAPSAKATILENDRYNQTASFERVLLYDVETSADWADMSNRRAAESVRFDAESLTGTSTAFGMLAGHVFTVTNHPRRELDGQDFVISQMSVESDEDGVHIVRFTGNPPSHPFGTVRDPFDTIYFGPSIATVVRGPGDSPAPWDPGACMEPVELIPPPQYDATQSSEFEIWTYGVYVEFPWDRGTPYWVRLGAGMQTAPEIGAVVLVGPATGLSMVPEIVGMIWSHGAINAPAVDIPHTTIGDTSSYQVGTMQFVIDGTMDNRNCGPMKNASVGANVHVQIGPTSDRASEVNTVFSEAEAKSTVGGGPYSNVSIVYGNSYDFHRSYGEHNLSIAYGNPTSHHHGNQTNLHIGNADSTHIGNATSMHLGDAASAHLGDAASVHLGNQASMHIGVAASISIAMSTSVHIGNNLSAHIGEAESMHLGDAASMHLGNQESMHLGNAMNMHLGDQMSMHLGDAMSMHLGDQMSMHLGDAMSMHLGDQMSMHLGDGMSIGIGDNMNMHIGSSMDMTMATRLGMSMTDSLDMSMGVHISIKAVLDLEINVIKMLM